MTTIDSKYGTLDSRLRDGLEYLLRIEVGDPSIWDDPDGIYGACAVADALCALLCARRLDRPFNELANFYAELAAGRHEAELRRARREIPALKGRRIRNFRYWFSHVAELWAGCLREEAEAEAAARAACLDPVWGLKAGDAHVEPYEDIPVGNGACYLRIWRLTLPSGAVRWALSSHSPTRSAIAWARYGSYRQARDAAELLLVPPSSQPALMKE